MKKKGLLSAVLTIVLCLSLIAGSTFALFTDVADVNVSVTAGNVELSAVYDTSSMLTWSLNETQADADRADANGINHFDNDGIAYFSGSTVVVDRMTPGDVAKFMINVSNTSNVNIQYRIRMYSRPVEVLDDAGQPTGAYYTDLTPALVTTAYVDGFNYEVLSNGNEKATQWKFIDANADINDVWVTVNFPNTSNVIAPKDALPGDPLYNPDNQYQNAKAEITFIIEAVQANGVEFAEAVTEETLFDGNTGYIANGSHNGAYTASGEKVVIPVTTEAIGVEGNVTLSNMKIDGSVSSDVATLFAIASDPSNPEETMLVIGEGAEIVAPKVNDPYARDQAILVLNVQDQTTTIMVDASAKIYADGTNGVAILTQGGTTNIVLNGDDLLVLTNGAKGFIFCNSYMETSVVNIFVKDFDAMAAYEALIAKVDAGVTVHWYVDGAFVK